MHDMHDITKKWDILQGYGVQRLDMGLVYEASVSCGSVFSYEHAQALD